MNGAAPSWPDRRAASRPTVHGAAPASASADLGRSSPFPAHRPLLLLLGGFLVLHLALMGWDQVAPSAFLNADRARPRWELIQQWIAIGNLAPDARGSAWTALLLANGNPGDYLPQAIVLAALGREGLVAVQVGLMLLAGAAVHAIGRDLGLSPALARWATAAFLIWPHSLVFAHQLSTEAWHTPLLVIGTAAFLRGVRAGASPMWWCGAGLLLGGATLVRPVTLLWPALLGLGWALRGATGRAATFVVVGLLPVLLWSAWMGVQTGHFGMGASSRDLGHNLYQRVARIVETLPADRQQQVRMTHLATTSKVLGVGDYASFAVSEPGATLQHLLRDAAVFAFKSGVERIPIDYVGLDPAQRARLQNGDLGWRRQLETDGPLAALGALWRDQGAVLVLGLLGVPLMAALWVLAARGAIRAWRNGPRRETGRAAVAVLAGLLVYIAAMSTVADTVQSRLRAPAEFALFLLAVAGWPRRDRAREAAET